MLCQFVSTSLKTVEHFMYIADGIKLIKIYNTFNLTDVAASTAQLYLQVMCAFTVTFYWQNMYSTVLLNLWVKDSKHVLIQAISKKEFALN